MKSVKVYHYDAFSQEPNKGNPAGVVLNGEDFSEAEMQEIALRAGFSETAFITKSDIATLGIRYFKPGREMDLCGHATMASVYALKTRGLLEDRTKFTMETKAGVLPIRITETKDETRITMKQATPQFKKFKGDVEALANSLGITPEDIDSELPIVYGSTGNWTLIVPIKELSVFKRMMPNTEAFPSVLAEIPDSSIHPLCLKTYHSDADMHGRHFCSPYSGAVEDAITGTASGVMGAYYATFIDNCFEKPLNLVVEQGQEINKDGRVRVQVSRDEQNLEVEITGSAIYVEEFDLDLGGRNSNG
ncbi:PhzF family phenazine biosynthesis isomerase [Radiobacillus deserti]|uniref:PhzF family phenazine biosynthesis isomerase n=1 Tax=Radiobacillus deserti TaxID=2594883 RepID=A0A516KDC2_9BACI|nr:PhzF family phenazine biosynthesis isomerase [Radiobacillus deserti]QDP39399.1 PhzF family phenazine biosynthesis isomerase [Radiobacillus deserti]